MKKTAAVEGSQRGDTGGDHLSGPLFYRWLLDRVTPMKFVAGCAIHPGYFVLCDGAECAGIAPFAGIDSPG